MSNGEAKEPEVLTDVGGTLAVREPSPGEMIQSAIKSGATPEVLQTLAELYERFKASAAREAFVTALSDFQSKCPVITKTKPVYSSEDKGGGERYRYAPMDVIVVQVREILHECGLSYTIDDEFKDGLMYATCTVTHILGHSESSTFMAPIDPKAYMNAPQKYASANTYAKRYAFCNALGILTGDEDDDARQAGERSVTGNTAESKSADSGSTPDAPASPGRDLGEMEPGDSTHEKFGKPEADEPPPHEDPDQGAPARGGTDPSAAQIKFYKKLDAEMGTQFGDAGAVERMDAIQERIGFLVTSKPDEVYTKREFSRLITELVKEVGWDK